MFICHRHCDCGMFTLLALAGGAPAPRSYIHTYVQRGACEISVSAAVAAFAAGGLRSVRYFPHCPGYLDSTRSGFGFAALSSGGGYLGRRQFRGRGRPRHISAAVSALCDGGHAGSCTYFVFAPPGSGRLAFPLGRHPSVHEGCYGPSHQQAASNIGACVAGRIFRSRPALG